MAASVVAAGVTSEAKGAEMQVAEVTVGNPEPERLAADRVAVGVATEEAAPEVEGRVVAPAAAAEEGREVDMAAERATGTMVKAAAITSGVAIGARERGRCARGRKHGATFRPPAWRRRRVLTTPVYWPVRTFPSHFS